MAMVRIRNGFGKHFDSEALGGKEHLPGVPFDDQGQNLVAAFPDKFEAVTGATALRDARQAAHPCGEDVSDKHPVIIELLQEVVEGTVQIFQKGRRLRILIDNDVQDTDPSPIVNVKQLTKAARNLKKDIQAANGSDDDETPEGAEGEEEETDNDEKE